MPDSLHVNLYPKTKKYVLLYFHAHQPFRINNYYSMFDFEGEPFDYFDGPSGQDNKTIIDRVVERNYIPAGEMFLDLIQNKSLKISYSFTGTLLEQLQMWAPQVIDLYRKMYDTGQMELICETYYHSLAAFYDQAEFVRQVRKHSEVLGELFGARPRVFRNTELSYRNDVGEMIRRLGFKAAFTEGWDKILDWRSPNYMYRNKPVEFDEGTDRIFAANQLYTPEPELKLLLKNYKRSDDVAFRFQLKGWEGYPVTAEKVATWISQEMGYLTCMCMDYETVGEHHRVESGIFEFYKHFPEELAKRGIEFILPSDAAKLFSSEEELDYHDIVSWADAERDLSAWNGNDMQKKSLEAIYKFGNQILFPTLEHLPLDQKEKLLHTWGKLQTSDHFYYMSTKYWSDGDVHKYFSPYETPFQAYGNFANVLGDFRERLRNDQ